MVNNRKAQRYERIYNQIADLTKTIDSKISGMATASAILHHKMDDFFWTGFYLLSEKNELLVGPYQGPLACLRLAAHTGVCWAGIDKNETVIVDDVEQFPGHIACSSKSKSEIVIPLRDETGNAIGVMDVDSESLSTFDETDQIWLEKICRLIGY